MTNHPIYRVICFFRADFTGRCDGRRLHTAAMTCISLYGKRDIYP